ncbi:hypothetical protein [Brevibacillus fortis]|uniref:hypothetical protein n=1 Tax=Brevibacillus fortis TaxID=2126352 RepID=UPI0038FC3965
MRKKEQLDDFANQKQITFNDLHKIVKGKWLLSAFVQSVYSKIQELHSKCSQKALDGLKMCQYCEIGKDTQCLWKIKRHHSLQIAETLVLDYLDDTELDYIYTDLQTLA